MEIPIAVGSIITSLVMYIFIMPVIKGALFQALCGIGTAECSFGLLAFYIIPALPIILFVIGIAAR